MKAICQREGLLMAFQLASSAVPSKEIKPILQNLKAVAEDNRCTLMATDLELGIRLDVLGLTIEEPGDAIFPAQQFLKILRESQNTELHIEADSNACIVQGKGMYFEMPSEDPGNFPDIPTFDGEDYFEIAAGELREMIRRTIFATAEGESARFTMTGVLWEIEGESLSLVATDGKRLALAEGKGIPHGAGGEKKQAIVPPKAMALLEKNLQDQEEIIKISPRNNEVLFRTELATIYSLLVEGRFPDFRNLFNRKPGTMIPLEVGAFQAAVRQAAIMTEDDSKRVIFHFDSNNLTMKARGARSGSSKVELPIVYDGGKVEISFNPQYLIEMLRILPSDAEVQLDLVDGSTPALFRSEPYYSYLVMPFTG